MGEALEYSSDVQREVRYWQTQIGVELPRVNAFNTVATIDAICHYATGIGDDNLLWLDPGYAKHTRYGGIIAPPLFIYTAFPRGGLGLPSFSGLHIGESWRFHQPVQVNDEMNATFSIREIRPKRIRIAKRALLQLTDYKFTNQRDELIAERTLSEFRFLPDDAVLLEDMDVPLPSYTEEDLRSIDLDYENEVKRGGEPRFWDDVTVEEKLPRIVKGPMSLRDAVAHYIGSGSHRHTAHRYFWKFKREHPEPEGIMIDPDTGLAEVRSMYILKDSSARARGLPRAMEVGPFRMANLMHLVTNWMGDDGFVVEFEGQARIPVYFGDTYRCSGSVTSKFERNGNALVELVLAATNQRGQVISPGRALVKLPSRASHR